MRRPGKKNAVAAIAVLPFIAAGSQAYAAAAVSPNPGVKAKAAAKAVDTIAGFPSISKSIVVAGAKTVKNTKTNVSPVKPPTIKKPPTVKQG